MRFSKSRAEVFGRYTLSGLLKKVKPAKDGKFILWLTRSELASLLGMSHSRLEHIQCVADEAAKEGIVTGTCSGWVYFFPEDEGGEHGDKIDVSHAMAITDAFEKVHGSQACDDIWEDWVENGNSPGAPTKELKPRGRGR